MSSSSTDNLNLPFPLTHGYLLKDRKDLPLPACSSAHAGLSRPDMKNGTGITKSEFLDSPEVLIVKADLFIDMCKRSKALGILLGAGISRSSGIADYASANQQQQRLTKAFTESLRPTPAHRVLVAMYKSGAMNLFDCLQQNHDGLLNLAGMPKDKVNEMHGSWKDSVANPVVPMSGNLRSDLCQRMYDLEKNQDMGFAIGTSLSGLNADRILATPCKRAQNPKKYGTNQLGGVILAIQQTPYDQDAALRIFATTDEFMMLVAHRLKLEIDFDTDYNYHSGQPYKVPVNRRAPSTIAAMQRMKEWDAYFAAKKNSSGGAAVAAPSSGRVNADAAVATTATSSAGAAQANSNQDAATATTIPKKSSSTPPQIFVGNYHAEEASSDGENNNKHRWTMFVRSSRPGVINSVVYHLHPTFKPNAIKVSSASTPNNKYPESEEFTLSRLGWGTFEVGVEIELVNNNGKIIKTKHDLQFQQGEYGQQVAL